MGMFRWVTLAYQICHGQLKLPLFSFEFHFPLGSSDQGYFCNVTVIDMNTWSTQVQIWFKSAYFLWDFKIWFCLYALLFQTICCIRFFLFCFFPCKTARLWNRLVWNSKDIHWRLFSKHAELEVWLNKTFSHFFFLSAISYTTVTVSTVIPAGSGFCSIEIDLRYLKTDFHCACSS